MSEHSSVNLYCPYCGSLSPVVHHATLGSRLDCFSLVYADANFLAMLFGIRNSSKSETNDGDDDDDDDVV